MLCGQIESEMTGQTVLVAGMVASVSHLFTKANKPWIKAVLEDLDGSIEVIAWSDVYTETVDLWEEGTIVLVEGKVGVRDEGVQLNCKKVSRYQPGQVVQKKPAVEVRPPVVANGKASYYSQPITNDKPAISSEPVSRYRLVISISGTTDGGDDINRLHRVIYIIKEFPGRDEVSLRIINNGKTVNLKLPNIYTGFCPELRERLIELVGEAGFRVEPLGESI
jgi:hypothetical protein